MLLTSRSRRVIGDLSPEGYDFVHVPRPSTGGGDAILHKDSIRCVKHYACKLHLLRVLLQPTYLASSMNSLSPKSRLFKRQRMKCLKLLTPPLRSHHQWILHLHGRWNCILLSWFLQCQGLLTSHLHRESFEIQWRMLVFFHFSKSQHWTVSNSRTNNHCQILRSVSKLLERIVSNRLST